MKKNENHGYRNYQNTIPVRPGRNLSVIIEVAAMNYRLKRMGVNAAEQFSDRLNNAIADPDMMNFKEKKGRHKWNKNTATKPGSD